MTKNKRMHGREHDEKKGASKKGKRFITHSTRREYARKGSISRSKKRAASRGKGSAKHMVLLR